MKTSFIHCDFEGCDRTEEIEYEDQTPDNWGYFPDLCPRHYCRYVAWKPSPFARLLATIYAPSIEKALSDQLTFVKLYTGKEPPALT